MHGTIVCGVTQTAEARAAAQLAAALAARLGLRLVLVHVHAAHGPPAREEREPGIERMAHELGGEIEARVIRGDPAEALARAAADEGADVIVLGARARGSRRQLRCGLAYELEAATDVPVLIAPPATRPRSGRRLSIAETPRGR
jgi:nucleotide-binding universal stress UspA family protein